MTTTNIAIERHNRYAATILAIAMLLTIGWFAGEMASRDKITVAHAQGQIEPRTVTPEDRARAAKLKKEAEQMSDELGKDKAQVDKLKQDMSRLAGDAKPSPYMPNADQSKDLRIAQLEAINAQQAMSNAQSAFQSAVNGLAAVCRKVVADNKWPADVQCNPDMNPVAFTRSAAAATAATGTPAKK